MVKTVEFLMRENIRADSYKLLSECYHAPDKELITLLHGLAQSEGGLYAEIAKHIPHIDEIESLTIDYSKLFVGPFKLLAPPYGSLYLENGRTVMNNSTINAQKRYKKEGLAIALKEVPDHIVFELEFMYFLIVKETEAIQNSDLMTANHYFNKQKSFLETHLGMWVTEFTEKVKNHAQTAFYQNVARCTQSFVKNDLKKLLER